MTEGQNIRCKHPRGQGGVGELAGRLALEPCQVRPEMQSQPSRGAGGTPFSSSAGQLERRSEHSNIHARPHLCPPDGYGL